MYYERTLRQTLLPALIEAERYRTLMKDGAAYGIFVVDVRGNVVAWGTGAERLFLYPKDEILGQHFSRLFFRSEEVYRGEPEHELRTAAVVGQASADRWYARKGGTALWCCGVTAPLPVPAGCGRHFVKVLRDATDLKRSDAAAAELCASDQGFERILGILGCDEARSTGVGSRSFPELSYVAAAHSLAECRN